MPCGAIFFAVLDLYSNQTTCWVTGVNSHRGLGFSSSPPRPDRLYCPSSFLSRRYRR